MNESIYLLCVLRLTHSPHPLELPMVIQIRCNWSFTCCRFPLNNREPFAKSSIIITVRKRSLQRLCFSQVFVCPQGVLHPGGRGGGCIGGGGDLHLGGLHPRGVYIQSGVCIQGICIQRESASRGVYPPPRSDTI